MLRSFLYLIIPWFKNLLLGLQLPFVNEDGIESMLRPLPNVSDMWQLLSKISSSGIITVYEYNYPHSHFTEHSIDRDQDFINGSNQGTQKSMTLLTLFGVLVSTPK